MGNVKSYSGSSAFVFVSYAHADGDRAPEGDDRVTPVIAYLQRRGYNIWFDEGIHPGADWDATLDERIRSCSCLLAFVSARSLASPECAKELRRALDLGKPIVSVFLEPLDPAAAKTDVARELLRLQGIERYRMEGDAEFYLKLLEHGLFEPCRDTEEYQVLDGNLVRYNGTATSVVVPDYVTQIGYNAFEGCSSLQWVSIPAGVDRLGKFAFNDTPALCEFQVDPANGFFSSVNGVLFNKNANYLLCYPSARPAEVYHVPAGTRHIGMVAFSQANVLTSVDMPDTVFYLGDRCFEACRNLVEIRVSPAVRKIRPYTFSRCTSLVACELPASLEELGDGAFSGCFSLERIELPATLVHLGEMAFAHCGCLREVVLPAGVKQVPEYGFHECAALVHVDLGSAREVGQYAFKNCEALAQLELPATVESIGRAAFSGCTALARVHIPGSVASVGEYSFDRCPRLDTVVFEDGVREILEGAFDKDTALRRVVLPASVEHVHPRAFPEWTEVVRA